MHTFADVIESIGAARISGRMRVPYQTVAAWKRRGSIPPEYWPALLDLARAASVDLAEDALVRMAAARRPARAA